MGLLGDVRQAQSAYGERARKRATRDLADALGRKPAYVRMATEIGQECRATPQWVLMSVAEHFLAEMMRQQVVILRQYPDAGNASSWADLVQDCDLDEIVDDDFREAAREWCGLD